MTRRVIAGWTLCYGLASWLVEYLFAQLDARSAHPFLFSLSRMVYAVYWGMAAWVAVAMTDWRPVTSSRQYARIALHLLVCAIVVVAWGTLAYYTNLAIVPGWEPLGLPLMLASTSKNVLFGYGVLVVLVHVVWWVRRHRANEVEALARAERAALAELQVLKMELQPHFLFNALHSVSVQIQRDPTAANEMLVRISDLLHHAVRTSRVLVVPLREELRTLRLYTDIEQARFEERLRITWNVPDALGDALVPHMLLQPLVENAIKYAIEPRSTPGHVELSAREVDAHYGRRALELRLLDDGPGPHARSARSGAGVGLRITQERLLELYGGQQSFEIAAGERGGTLVRIVVPLQRRAAEPAPITEVAEPVRPTTTVSREGTSPIARRTRSAGERRSVPQVVAGDASA
jgi:two-component sensor histidine kinase